MAGSRTYRTQVIVLGKTKLKENDLILILLAENGGQVRAVAKGARKPGGRLAARCELFSTADLLLAHGRTLDIVSEARLVEAPLAQNACFETVSAASAVAEVARLCSFEDASDSYLFPITQKALACVGALDDGARLDVMVAAYIFKVLAHIGYRPDLSACVACGDPAVSWFSAAAGGLLCASCASSVAGAEQLGASEVGWLRALMGLRFDELMAVEVDAPTAAFVLSLAHSWAATHLDARLRALEFLLGV